MGRCRNGVLLQPIEGLQFSIGVVLIFRPYKRTLLSLESGQLSLRITCGRLSILLLFEQLHHFLAALERFVLTHITKSVICC